MRFPGGRKLCIVAYTEYHSDARILREAETAVQGGYEVDVITPRRKGESKKTTVNKVNIYRVGVQRYVGPENLAYVLSYLRFFVRCFFRISWLHINNGYQIIHVNNMPDILVFTTLIAKLSGARIILDIHDPMPETYLAKFGNRKNRIWYRSLLFQERVSAAYSDIVLTVHEPLKRDILEKHGIKREKISVIKNFADDRIFVPADSFKISGQIRMIFYGTIAERFGFEAVLKAISNVSSKRLFHLKIIGRGDYEYRLGRIIKGLGLIDTVDFENIVYPLAQLPVILRQYHLGLVPYNPCQATDYMLPVKMMELLAMGIPVVTISNVPISYYVDKSMYFSYNPRNMDSLTELIETIVNDPALILKKREDILINRERFIWKNESKKYLALLECLSN
jgi:glycosyltransferase involved in cell wall biosynthesis